ncbi:thymidine phosphorylase [candidate division KSB1 bacterium]|nr:thymidine phosphorylase [candidate division KSB1 bacterium]RQW06015.1 MAG: thymidine phosphorylase [candidate division KSB1 bacterium]
MTAYHIIAKKRDGLILTVDEIDYIIHGYAQNKIPDYQMSALLMAIYLNGMTFEETAALTCAMLESGFRMNFKNVPGQKIDKHSTGGVGDKVSLILAPLVAAAGLKVPMLSGRALSHSGGTLDKLESIPGFRTNLSVDEFYQQIEQIGVSMIGQTERICPADKKMYALRDATATIESIPLITGSILSKKLAEGIDGLVLDVKTGSGAFMRRLEDARALAESLVKTAMLNSLPTRALITRMDEPLGYAAGNWVEVKEAIDCLHGNGPDDLMQVTLALSAQMLLMGNITKTEAEARDKLNQLIHSGAALQKFYEIVRTQGGNLFYLDHPEKYAASKIEQPVFAPQTGTISSINALDIGLAVVQLGGGRFVMEDQIDYKAGIVLAHKVGDYVKKGEKLATLFTDHERVVEEVSEHILTAFQFQKTVVAKKSLVIDIIEA